QEPAFTFEERKRALYPRHRRFVQDPDRCGAGARQPWRVEMTLITEDKMKKDKNPNLTNKYVYFFGNGKAEGTKDQRTLLGGKGANLAEMTNLGIPVPPGFTISTVAC